MAVRELWFVLLLLTFFIDCKVTLVKTTEGDPYVTPICTNETKNIIILVSCKIRTERSRGEECHLAYKYGEEIYNGCDSRFTFMKKNQTVYLNLTSLTPVDSGNYSCECTHPGVTKTLRLNITVEENSSVTVADEEATSSTKISVVSSVAVGVTVFIIITGVILGFIYRRKHHRNNSRTDTSGSSVCKTLGSLTRDDPDDPYTSLQQPANNLYETISSIHHQHDAKKNSASK